MAAQRAPLSNVDHLESAIKIMRQSYRCDERNMLFILKDCEGNTFEKTAPEIASERDLMLQMSKDDIFTVGYVAGMELENNNL